MPYAVRVHEYGGPEVLMWEEVEIPAPGAGEAHIKQTAIGLNYIDVYHRTGLYPQPSLPFTIGCEAVGVVLSVGEDVSNVQVGDRVAYASVIGGYAQERLISAERLVKVPDAVSDKVAAASMLQGMTAEYLLKRTYPVQAGEVVLYHAAAGGVGLILCQWAKALGGYCYRNCWVERKVRTCCC